MRVPTKRFGIRFRKARANNVRPYINSRLSTLNLWGDVGIAPYIFRLRQQMVKSRSAGRENPESSGGGTPPLLRT